MKLYIYTFLIGNRTCISFDRFCPICVVICFTNRHSNQFKLILIISYIARHRLVKPVSISIAKKDIDAIKLSNILHHKSIQSKFLPITKISLYLSFLIPIHNQLQLKFSITNARNRILILTSSLYIIRMATLLLLP